MPRILDHKPHEHDIDTLKRIISGMQGTLEILVQGGIVVVAQDTPKIRATKPRKPKSQRAKIPSRGFQKSAKSNDWYFANDRG